MIGLWCRMQAVIVLLFAFILNVSADPATGRLGIARDGRAQLNHYAVWSSKATYDSDTKQFSDIELYSLAKEAYEEMEKQWVDNVDEFSRPGMMAALAVGKDIFFSSSIKGSGDKRDKNRKRVPLSFIYEYNELKKNGRDDRSHLVNQRLKACQLALFQQDPSTSRTHNSHASCAEILAIHKFYYNKQDMNVDALPLRVAAFGRPGGVLGAVAIPHRPCGEGETWGCKQGMEYLNIAVAEFPTGDLPPVKTGPTGTKIINAC